MLVLKERWLLNGCSNMFVLMSLSMLLRAHWSLDDKIPSTT